MAARDEHALRHDPKVKALDTLVTFGRNRSALIMIRVLWIAGLFVLTTCSFQESHRGGQVKVWEINDFDGLNPHTSVSASAHALFPMIFQKLLAQSFSGPELLPVLAKSRPGMTAQEDSMIISWELRPEARWDNGEPITVEDVEFSFKAMMCPGVNSQSYHPYIDFIREFRKHEDDPLRFDMLCNRVYVRAEYSAGGEVYILPRYVYDPDGLLSEFSYAQLVSDPSLRDHDRVRRFAERFNSERTARDTGKVIGSGAYKFSSWETGQRLSLSRKEDWWGDRIDEPGNMYFEANPDRITHEVITDFAAAVTALKARKIDVMRGIPSTDFDELKQNQDVLDHFELSTAPFLAFAVIAINMRNPKLADVRTRQALCHLMDYDRVIKDIQLGYAERVVGPVHPSAGAAYNGDLALYQYDVARAGDLLRQAGWADSDGDGVLDQRIAGKKRDLSIALLINQGNTLKEQIALVYQQGCEKAGVRIEIVSVEGGTFNQRLKAHDFELAYTAWVFEQAPTDFTQLFGTTGWSGGDNYSYFGDARSDALIARINTTLDEAERAPMIRELQALIHEQVPYVVLWAPLNKIAINSRFSNTYVSITNPGYWVPGFIDQGEKETASK
jgi:peptide/nickel transport system substrate-binding protein